VIADEDDVAISDEAPRSHAARLRRHADPFAGLPIAHAALEFASACHAGQYRELDHAPFIAHPSEVGLLLQRDGQPEDVIAAGLLHDVLEKTATSRAELERRFGPRIMCLVVAVSDDPSISGYKARKRELRARVAHADSDTATIFAADKVSKVRELKLLPPLQLRTTRLRAKLAHYRASLQTLRQVAGEAPLVDLLDAELNRITPPAADDARGASTSTSRRTTRAFPERIHAHAH
jgi:(p)ppGpp synthase/HD superfamily hydrolase